MSSLFNPLTVFKSLSSKEFSTYKELEIEVLRSFNRFLQNFPPAFTHRDLIRWGLFEGYIEKRDSRFSFNLELGEKKC